MPVANAVSAEMMISARKACTRNLMISTNNTAMAAAAISSNGPAVSV